MLRFGETKTAKEKFYAAKKPINICDVNVDNIVISKLIETKTNSKYLIGIKFDKTIRPLVLMMPKMSGYVKTFKVKEGNKDKTNKLMSFPIVDEKLLEKYKAIWTKIALPVYDDRYIKTKIRTYGDKTYTNFRELNVPEDDIKCESFTVISIDYYSIDYLDNCAYKIVNKQMTDYLDENLFED